MNTSTQEKDSKQTLGFQTEVKQLLQLMIHSLYSNKDIFLRELISNASDACDKLRFEALAQPALFEGDAEFGIKVLVDAQAKTITIEDNGIGMNRDEAIDHLGTIAKSGTKEFFGKLTGDQQKDAELIGQFGVGFYSAFIVADTVTVRSRKAGLGQDQGVEWISKGDGEFTVEAINKPSRGTQVVLHLRAEEEELLTAWKLRNIVARYSDHIALPIQMQKEEWDEDSKTMKITDAWETVNKASALWTRSKSEISEDDYTAFYKTISHDYANPLAYTHNRVEGGRSDYISLLYIPSKAPFDLWDRNQQKGIKLYVKRVFIMDDAEQLLPPYLRFVKGVIDSGDLPLNVSREILQESRDVKAIREGSVKKILGLLEDLADQQNEQKNQHYSTFWQEFGQVLKEGVGEDQANRERIAKLLRFASTAQDSTEQNVSLAQYVARMKPDQDKIYYVTADTYTAAKNSPHLEIFSKKGVEVLLLTDRVDEWMLSYLNDFEGKSLQSCAKGGLDLGALEDAAEKEAQQQVEGEYQDLVAAIQEVLKDRVQQTRLSYRLTESPACVVADDMGMSEHLKRLLKSAGQNAPDSKPVLELNPQHPLVKRLQTDRSQLDIWAHVLLDQAVLAEGGHLEDPAAFVRRTNQLLGSC